MSRFWLRNPFPGQIINQPNGPDVYKGVVKDYTGKVEFQIKWNKFIIKFKKFIYLQDVTPTNFLKILQGEKIDVGSKKVINRLKFW